MDEKLIFFFFCQLPLFTFFIFFFCCSHTLCQPSHQTSPKYGGQADATGQAEGQRLHPGVPHGRRWGVTEPEVSLTHGFWQFCQSLCNTTRSLLFHSPESPNHCTASCCSQTMSETFIWTATMTPKCLRATHTTASFEALGRHLKQRLLHFVTMM